MSTTMIILAAGKSTRMHSSISKVMHLIAEKPMLSYVLETANKAKADKVILVTSASMSQARELADKECPNILHAIQEELLGTGSAIMAALPLLDKTGRTVIMYGDTPFVTPETVNSILKTEADLLVVSFHDYHSNQYGRLITYNDDLLSIVEFADASNDEKEISHCNSGIYSVNNQYLHQLMPLIKNNNKQKEFYLTDIIKLAVAEDLSCKFFDVDEEEVLGINTREDLSYAQDIMQDQIKARLLNQGVSIINPGSSYISADFKAAIDVTIYPNVFIGANVSVGSNVNIYSFSHLEGVTIANNVNIGPFARIRPETKIADAVRIGNFVEIKNSQIDRASKICHLSYIGDTEIGSETNIGAGTITCNYDGISKKSKTKIGNKVSIGSNTSLIAPVTVADGAYVAAGSVITKDIEPDDLAIARARQINLSKKARDLRDGK